MNTIIPFAAIIAIIYLLRPAVAAAATPSTTAKPASGAGAGAGAGGIGAALKNAAGNLGQLIQTNLPIHYPTALPGAGPSIPAPSPADIPQLAAAGAAQSIFNLLNLLPPPTMPTLAGDSIATAVEALPSQTQQTQQSAFSDFFGASYYGAVEPPPADNYAVPTASDLGGFQFSPSDGSSDQYDGGYEF